MRKFESGATRDVDTSKLDYEGFIHPLVLERYAQYMHENRVQADGSLRTSDNWQKGIPKDVYMKSAFRHFMDVWKEHRGIKTSDGIEKAICALMFNIQGYLFEHLKERSNVTATEIGNDYNRAVDEFDRLNKRVSDYLQETLDQDIQRAFTGRPIPRYAQGPTNPQVYENGDYDPRHDGKVEIIETGGCAPPVIAPVPSVAILAADTILAIHPQWPEGEVDPLAPESCVSRCY